MDLESNSNISKHSTVLGKEGASIFDCFEVKLDSDPKLSLFSIKNACEYPDT